jgi:hypothetical protein
MSAALAAAGCANEAATVPTTVTSAGISVDVDPAVDQITADRCNRQLSCGNIGKGMTWRDRHDCVDRTMPQTRNLVGQSCKSVDAARLHACISDIRNQLCDQSGNVPVSCEGANLCR